MFRSSSSNISRFKEIGIGSHSGFGRADDQWVGEGDAELRDGEPAPMEHNRHKAKASTGATTAAVTTGLNGSALSGSNFKTKEWRMYISRLRLPMAENTRRGGVLYTADKPCKTAIETMMPQTKRMRICGRFAWFINIWDT